MMVSVRGMHPNTSVCVFVWWGVPDPFFGSTAVIGCHAVSKLTWLCCKTRKTPEAGSGVCNVLRPCLSLISVRFKVKKTHDIRCHVICDCAAEEFDRKWVLVMWQLPGWLHSGAAQCVFSTPPKLFSCLGHIADPLSLSHADARGRR